MKQFKIESRNYFENRPIPGLVKRNVPFQPWNINFIMAETTFPHDSIPDTWHLINHGICRSGIQLFINLNMY